MAEEPDPGPDAVGDLREEIEASGIVGLPQQQRDEIFFRIHALATEHGGLTETYVGVLNVAR